MYTNLLNLFFVESYLYAFYLHEKIKFLFAFSFYFNAFNLTDSTFKEITKCIITNIPLQIINNPGPVPCHFYFKVNNVAFSSSTAIPVYDFSNDSFSISIYDMLGKGLILHIKIIAPET